MDGQTFTDGQVVAAIRAACFPRSDTSLTQEEAAAYAATYRANLAHYREHVQRSLDESDYLQVAEKSWGTFTQAIKAIGADHQIKLSSHVGIFRVAGELAALASQSDPEAARKMNQAATVASGLHTHFYENNLTDAMVIQSAVTVSEAIDLLRNGSRSGKRPPQFSDVATLGNVMPVQAVKAPAQVDDARSGNVAQPSSLEYYGDRRMPRPR